MGRTVFVLEPYEPFEDQLQIDCTKMLERILLEDVQWTAIAHEHSLDPTIGRNGRPIGLIQAQKRKARGVKAGIWDYLFWHRRRAFAIELKRNADEPLSDSQKEFGLGLKKAGVLLKVCWSKPLVLETVVEWGLTRVHVDRPWRVSGGVAA